MITTMIIFEARLGNLLFSLSYLIHMYNKIYIISNIKVEWRKMIALRRDVCWKKKKRKYLFGYVYSICMHIIIILLFFPCNFTQA